MAVANVFVASKEQKKKLCSVHFYDENYTLLSDITIVINIIGN